jgi:hypothetical protein
MIDQARERRNKHQGTIISSTIIVLGIAEKGLDGLPISGVPKAVIGGVKDILAAVQVGRPPGLMSSSKTSHITENVRERGVD